MLLHVLRITALATSTCWNPIRNLRRAPPIRVRLSGGKAKRDINCPTSCWTIVLNLWRHRIAYRLELT